MCVVGARFLVRPEILAVNESFDLEILLRDPELCGSRPECGSTGSISITEEGDGKHLS